MIRQLPASTFAQLALDMYRRDGETEADWQLRLCREHDAWRCHFVVGPTSHCVVLQDFEQVLIAFRGTAEAEDWWRNVEGWPSRDFVPGLVHDGFRATLNDVWPRLHETIRQARAKERGFKPVTLIGHSLGGALATLAAARLERYAVRCVQLATFGAPAVGNRAFARSLQSTTRIHRYVCAADLVPRLKTGWLLGYRHAGAAKYFDAAGNFHPSSRGWWQWWDRWSNSARLDAIRDHGMQHYRDLIVKNEELGQDLL